MTYEAAVREVLEECRRSRRHFGDVLVERDDAAVDRWLERVSTLPNVLGCALLDPRSGRPCWAVGARTT